MKDGDCSGCQYIYTRKSLKECWFLNKADKACTDGSFLISWYYRTYNYLGLQHNLLLINLVVVLDPRILYEDVESVN